MKEVILTHEGLSRLSSTRDFVLKTDDARVDIECSRSQISFVSPIVAKMLANDPTVDKFALKTKKSSRCSELMSSLLSGKRVTVTGDMISIFYSIALELGNEELFASIEEDLSLSNVLDIVQIKQFRSFDIENEIEFVASHFCELDQNRIINLDITIVDCILSSEFLVIKSEHDLFLFICDLISSHIDDNRYRIFLSYLRLEYLDSEDLSFVISSINEENISSFLIPIYRCLLFPSESRRTSEDDRERYQKTYVTNRKDKVREKFVNNESMSIKSIYVPYRFDNFDGIFSRLRQETKGNPVTNGAVGVQMLYNEKSDPSSLVDPMMREKVSDAPNDAFIIDFKDKRVALSGISVKAQALKRVVERNHMISLKIEGSNDKNRWTTIDEKNLFVERACEEYWSFKSSKPFRYIKVLMTEQGIMNNYQMSIQAIEFFGILEPKE